MARSEPCLHEAGYEGQAPLADLSWDVLETQVIVLPEEHDKISQTDILEDIWVPENICDGIFPMSLRYYDTRKRERWVREIKEV